MYVGVTVVRQDVRRKEQWVQVRGGGRGEGNTRVKGEKVRNGRGKREEVRGGEWKGEEKCAVRAARSVATLRRFDASAR